MGEGRGEGWSLTLPDLTSQQDTAFSGLILEFKNLAPKIGSAVTAGEGGDNNNKKSELTSDCKE